MKNPLSENVSTIAALTNDSDAEQGKSPLVLIVDDEATIRLPIRFSLENFGFRILEAESGEEAETIFDIQLPDLILLDVLMLGRDGFKTCEAIRQHPQGKVVPIVMMTSLEDEDTITSAFHAGATDFISKPLNLLVLGYRIRYWLRSSDILSRLQLSEQRLSKAQEIAGLGHWEWNVDTGKIKVRCKRPENFGLEASTSYEELILSMVEEDQSFAAQQLDKAHQGREPFTLQYRILDEQGQEKIILNQGEFRTQNRSESVCVFGVMQDITEMKQAERKIRYLAFYDSLTGLANRALFKAHWKKIETLNRRHSRNIAVMFIDLDHFKQINDTLGHPVGDQVLIVIAERLKMTLRKSDVLSRTEKEVPLSLVSRVGGDEFTLLASSLQSPEYAATIAERVLSAIMEPIEIESQELNLSASIGISIYPQDGKDIDTLLKHADTAMYEAKNMGRGNYQFFYNEMNDVVQAKFMLQNRLRMALEKGEFNLFYQPKFSNTTGEIKGVEALIRWIDPEKGVVYPEDFLPFAEENNFIHTLNDWVISQACRQASRWVGLGLFKDCCMSINISGRGIDFPRLAQNICSNLKETGLEPRYLEIELTERVMMENTYDAKQALLKLKNLGVSIAIDDFGTGYSALSHLQVFPLTTLKIDKSFIGNIESSGNSQTILLSIINIAKSLNLKVIAEGVETEHQRTALKTMDCDELQGFLLSRPAPVEQIEKLLGSLKK